MSHVYLLSCKKALKYFVLDSMESGQVDEGDINVLNTDPAESMIETIRGHKVLATPAVRRLAMEKKVTILFSH